MTNNKKNVVVSVKDITKSFKIPLEGSNGLKQQLINRLKGRVGYRNFTPLENISFDIFEGDFFGIVGRNGSGKSTLLKTLAGIYVPQSGSIYVKGSLVPFIELGVGFNPELSGRENVFLNGALLGFSRKEMTAMYDEIVEFAELHDFMEERLKNYSSGMQVRLAFSIAIKAEGDILLLDEVLAVGDEAFQQKCISYFGNLKRNKKTVILVTHDMGAVERFCNRGILLDNGSIAAAGDNREIAEKYRELFMQESSSASEHEVDPDEVTANDIVLKKISTLQKSKKTGVIKAKTDFSIELIIESKKAIKKVALGINVVNSQNQTVLATGLGDTYDKRLEIKKGTNKISFTILQNIYNQDDYTIDVSIAEIDENQAQNLLIKKGRVAHFSIKGIKTRLQSLTHPDIVTAIEYDK